MAKLKFKSDVFKYSNESVFFIFFFVFIKMYLSGKLYQENKERWQNKARDRYQNPSEEATIN